MPQDFDGPRRARIDRDRDFVIGGQTFTSRASVRPEAMLAWSEIEPGETDAETLPMLDSLFKEFVLDSFDAHSRWDDLRAVEGDEAINLEDITNVIEWLVEEQAGRPTEASSGSPGSSPTTATGTGSTDGAASPAQIPAASTSGDS